MYDNIGGKIKSLAVWTFILEAIGSIITGIALGCDGDELYFLLCLIGPIVAWVSSWILYAFGELVEDVHAIRNKEGTTEEKAKREIETRTKLEAEEKAKREIEENIDNFVPNPSKTVIPDKYKDSYSCPKCGCTLKFGQKECLCSWQMDWSKYN